jgi:hypothetical protein
MYPVLPIEEREYDSGNPLERPHLDQKQEGQRKTAGEGHQTETVLTLYKFFPRMTKA